MSDALKPIEVFCSYAPEDESSFQQLQKHLRVLTRQGRIILWHHRLITPGTDWAAAIDTQVNRASVILLLISADFLDSDYCYGVEMKRALERQSMNEAWVIPILVRSVDWQKAPFAHLYVLPSNREPIVTMGGDQDKAWSHVVEGIRTALDEVHGLTFSTPPSFLPRTWMIPFARNRFFTGQAAILERLAETLRGSRTTALSQSQAISGLGGIGKTQIAIEYAHRHQEKYEAILWVQSDTHEALVSGYVALAEVLKIREKDERDQTIIIQAVVRWLMVHTGWLLILDNADDPSLVLPFLPSVHNGHILLTTRAQAVGTITDRLVVDALGQDEGALLLLRRARLIELNAPLEVALSADMTIAREISQELGGLPLALDQAGAYLEETGCSLSDYLDLFKKEQKTLLKRRGTLPADHLQSVTTTFSLAFEQVQQRNKAAIKLLDFCSYLAPDMIPLELITQGATLLGTVLKPVAANALQLDQALEVLHMYSLVQCDIKNRTLSIHRLVQAVLIDTMLPKIRKQWKKRAIQAVDKAFPEVAFEAWTRCERLLAHVLICAIWIDQETIFTLEASRVLHKAGIYLRERGQYSEAEPLLLQALSIYEQQLGAEHLDTAISLHNLAVLYWQYGKYEQAEPLYQRALAIREQHLGANHPDTAGSLNDLAELYRYQGKYDQAESLYQRALTIREQQLGANHPKTARSLNNLAKLYLQQGRYNLAESLFRRALTIREQLLGAEHPNTAYSLHGLAELYLQQEKYEQAEPLFQKALAIREQHLGVEHPETAESLHGLAELSQQQGKYKQSELLYQRVLSIREQCLGPNHPETQNARKSYAIFLCMVGRDAEATRLDTSQKR